MKATRKSHRKLLYAFLIVFLLVLFTLVIIEKGKTSGKEISTDMEVSVHQMDEETIVFLGNPEAENEMILLFDYVCPYCYQWMEEVFPFINEKWVESGKVMFRTQCLVLLSETSLQLSKIDQNLKDHYPELYYEVFFANDDINEIDSWLEDIKNLDHRLIENEPRIDTLTLTRKYVRTYALESVPTVIVNGEDVDNPFDINMMKQLFR